VIAVGVVVALMFGGGVWLIAAQHPGTVPSELHAAPRSRDWPVGQRHADAIREDALRRAAVRTEPLRPFVLPPVPDYAATDRPLICRFIAERPSGTTPKFDCVRAGGDVVKIKYGRNAEIHAEMLATRLLRGLGYAADEVGIARRVRCYGCPRYPFFAMRILTFVPLADVHRFATFERGFTDFEWVSVERRFPAATIETDTAQGWGWWELERSEAPREDLDAFRLLAVFLAHWDNKADNQRLVCLDPPGAVDRRCSSPIAMMQDLGSTFGPTKLNLVRWRDTPIWTDRAACAVSMRGMPFLGGTFPDVVIGENGRQQLLSQLSAIANDDLERLFVEARGPAFFSGTDDAGDVELWTSVFRHRVEQIRTAGPCPSFVPDRSGVD
jgi:hypothetical protein